MFTHGFSTNARTAKGRNGYFKLAHIEVNVYDNTRDDESVQVNLYSNRSSFPGPAYFGLSIEEARQMRDALDLAVKYTEEA